MAALAITGYTDADKVRARIGVDDADVDDATMASFQLDIQLEIELAKLGVEAEIILSDFESAPTDPTIKLRFNLLQLFSSSFCAAELVRGRGLLFPAMFKDGKAETRRFATLSVDAISASLDAETSKWRKALLENEGLLTTTAADTFSPVLIVKPGFDPVTNS